MRFSRTLGSIGLAAFAAIGTAGCGDDPQVPPRAVARVGDALIGKSAFERRAEIAAAYRLGRPPPYRPSDYRRCVLFKRGERPEGGSKPPSRASLLKQCRDEHNEVTRQAMQSLVLAEWLNQEAASANLHVSHAEIGKALKVVQHNDFGSTREYEKFLRDSKIPESFFLEQARGRVLTEKLMKKAQTDVPAVTRARVAAYYAKHRGIYRIPERRALLMLIARTRARAQAAKRALEHGKSWVAVARTYSFNRTAKETDVRVPEFSRAGGDKTLGDAVFGARRGVLTGPVKTSNGWFVFKVEKRIPAAPVPLKQAAPIIERRMRDEQQKQALDRYTAGFGVRFQAKTICADDFKIPECKNGPKARPGNTSAPTAPPPAPGNANH